MCISLCSILRNCNLGSIWSNFSEQCAQRGSSCQLFQLMINLQIIFLIKYWCSKVQKIKNYANRCVNPRAQNDMLLLSHHGNRSIWKATHMHFSVRLESTKTSCGYRALSYLSTQHMSSRCCGTCAGLRRAGQSERKQARKALVLLERSSLARPNHSRRRLGQVHSRKHRAGTSSGVRADLALPLLHSLTITGGTETQRQDSSICIKIAKWCRRSTL